MRKIFFAAIATLAVVFGNLAVASAAPQLGGGSAVNQPAQGTVLNYAEAGG
jgi:hypothetical protein